MSEFDDLEKKGKDLTGDSKKEFDKYLSELKKVQDASNIKIDIDGWEKATKDLKRYEDEIDEIEKKIKAATDDTTKKNLETVKEVAEAAKKSAKSQIDSATTVENHIFSSYSGALDKIKAVTHNTYFQYEIGEKIAKQYKSVNKSLGITGDRAFAVSKNFREALPDIERMGGTAEDLAETYKAFSDQSGRQNVLSAQNLKNMSAFALSTGLAEGEAARLYERFTLMGKSIDDSHKMLNELVNSSNKLGINSTKVLKLLTQEMSSMQRMSFKGGVEAMTEMAKLAVKMRMDISDMLGMADKFYEPEAAIEAAAQLQLMGGDIAAAFGDPFETMYLARNKPEELSKKLQTMTENMIEFNKETGEYDLPAEARQQLSFAAEQLGISKDRMIDLAFQSSKIKDIKMDVSGNIADDDMRETLAGMAQMKDGKWVVDVGGEQIDIADITQEQADKLKAFSDENIMKTQALATQTNTEAIENNTKAIMTDIAISTGMYELTEAGIKKSTQTASQIFGNMMGGIREYTNVIRDGATEVLASSDNQTSNYLSEAASMFGGQITGFLKESNFDKYKDQAEEGFNEITNMFERNSTIDKTINNIDEGSTKRVISSFYESLKTTSTDNTTNNTSNIDAQNINTNRNVNLSNNSQNVNVGGNVNVNLNVTADGSGVGNLTDEDKKKIQKNITNSTIKGVNSLVQGGSMSGQDNLILQEDNP